MDKSVGLHWMEQRDAEIDAWTEKIRQLVNGEKYEEALHEQLLLLEKHHELASCMRIILWDMVYDLDGRLRDMNTGAAWAILSEIYTWGVGGVVRRIDEALVCAQKAAEMGNGYGQFLAGYIKEFILGDGDSEEHLRCYMHASQTGCRVASSFSGTILADRQEWRRAARAYLRGGSFSSCYTAALRIIRSHPHEVTPWGYWCSTDTVILQIVMPSVFEAQRYWMLCAKRFGINRDVALIIAGFICTEPGWKVK